MTDFDDDERSASRSRPIDLYDIVTPTATYRITSHPVDVTFAGAIYKATTMSRGDLTSAQDLTGRELIIYLPVTHPLVRRHCATGVPEQRVRITLTRLQAASGGSNQQWSGFAGAMSIEGSGNGGAQIATVRVPSLTDDTFKVRLPMFGAQVLCNHRLYDSQCTVDRASAVSGGPFMITDIDETLVDGYRVTTSSTGSGSLYTFGDISSLRTKERRLVIAQFGPVLQLDVPFTDTIVGDIVEIAPGCDHTVTTCRDKFSNVVNFGGHPDLNATINPWADKGLGVVQQA